MLPAILTVGSFTMLSRVFGLVRDMLLDNPHRVRAVMPERESRELLQMADHQPCLQLIRRTWKSGRVVTRVTLTYPGDRYELGARYATNEYQLR